MNNQRRIDNAKQAITNLHMAIDAVKANPHPATAKKALAEYRAALKKQEALLDNLLKVSP
jgi:hypothetical protein